MEDSSASVGRKGTVPSPFAGNSGRSSHHDQGNAPSLRTARKTVRNATESFREAAEGDEPAVGAPKKRARLERATGGNAAVTVVPATPATIPGSQVPTTAPTPHRLNTAVQAPPVVVRAGAASAAEAQQHLPTSLTPAGVVPVATGGVGFAPVFSSAGAVCMEPGPGMGVTVLPPSASAPGLVSATAPGIVAASASAAAAALTSGLQPPAAGTHPPPPRKSVAPGNTKCDECGRTFSRPDALRRHMRVHTGEKPYKCATCGASFTQSGSLKSHQRTHTNERPFPCTVCGKAFGTRGYLTAHMRMHTGERPFTCAQCGKDFAWRHSLTVHMRAHSGARPYSCTECGKSFTTAANIRLHMLKHQAPSGAE